MLQNPKERKKTRLAAATLCTLLLCMGLLCGNASDISLVLDQHNVSDTVKVTVPRSGREIVVNVKLTEQKPVQ